jgi:hypothetical protein
MMREVVLKVDYGRGISVVASSSVTDILAMEGLELAHEVPFKMSLEHEIKMYSTTGCASANKEVSLACDRWVRDHIAIWRLAHPGLVRLATFYPVLQITAERCMYPTDTREGPLSRSWL